MTYTAYCITYVNIEYTLLTGAISQTITHITSRLTDTKGSSFTKEQTLKEGELTFALKSLKE